MNDFILEYSEQLIKIGVFFIMIWTSLFFHIKKQKRLKILLLINVLGFFSYLTLMLFSIEIKYLVAFVGGLFVFNIERFFFKNILRQTFFNIRLFIYGIFSNKNKINSKDKVYEVQEISNFKSRIKNNFYKDIKRLIFWFLIVYGAWIWNIVFYYFVILK